MKKHRILPRLLSAAIIIAAGGGLSSGFGAGHKSGGYSKLEDKLKKNKADQDRLER